MEEATSSATPHPAESNKLIQRFLQVYELQKITDEKENGTTALHIALARIWKNNKLNYYYKEVVQEILRHEDLRYMLRKFGTTKIFNYPEEELLPIHIAASYNNVEFIRQVAQIDKTLLGLKTQRGDTPLLLACNEKNVEAAQELLKYVECDINALVRGEHTALSYTAISLKPDLVRLFLSREDCDFNHRVDGFTPLLSLLNTSYGNSTSKIEVIKLLLQHPTCDINARTKSSKSAFDLMWEWSFIHRQEAQVASEVMLELFKDKRLDYSGVKCKNDYGRTLLHLASMSNCSSEILVYLAEKLLINIDSTDLTVGVKDNVFLNNATPLHLAAYYNNLEMFKKLIHYGADTTIPITIVDYRDKNGTKSLKVETIPLEEFALQKGNTEIAKMLLYLHNASLHQEYSKKDTLQEAKADPYKPVIENHIERKWGISLVPLIQLISGIASSVINIVFIMQTFVELVKVGRQPNKQYDLLRWMMNMTEFLFVICSLLLLLGLLFGLAFFKIIEKCGRIPPNYLLGKIPYIKDLSNRVAVLFQLFYFTKLSMAKFYFNMGTISSFLLLFVNTWSSTFREYKERKRFARVYNGFDKYNIKWLVYHTIVNILITVGCTLLFGYIIFIGSVSVLLKLIQMADLVTIYIGDWSFSNYFSFIALLNQLSTTQVIIIPEFQNRFKVAGGNVLHIQNLFYEAVAQRSLRAYDYRWYVDTATELENMTAPVFALLKCSARCDKILFWVIMPFRAILDPLYRLLTFLLFTMFPEPDKLSTLTRDIIKNMNLPTKRIVDIYIERHDEANTTKAPIAFSTSGITAAVLGSNVVEQARDNSLRNRHSNEAKESPGSESLVDIIVNA